MNSVHNGWKCDQCNKRFGKHYRLKQHHSFEHEGLSKPKCSLCDITFSNNDSLAVHIKNFHENGKVLIKRQCEECDEKFKFEKDLQAHIIDVHQRMAQISRRLVNPTENFTS